MKKIIPLAIILLIGLQACLFDKGEVPVNTTCDTLAVSYQDSIVPIITVHCSASFCHVSGGLGPGDFTQYDPLKATVTNGSLNQHLFVLEDMPDTSTGVPPLNDQQKQLFKCWIEAGGPNN